MINVFYLEKAREIAESFNELVLKKMFSVDESQLYCKKIERGFHLEPDASAISLFFIAADYKKYSELTLFQKHLSDWCKENDAMIIITSKNDFQYFPPCFKEELALQRFEFIINSEVDPKENVGVKRLVSSLAKKLGRPYCTEILDEFIREAAYLHAKNITSPPKNAFLVEDVRKIHAEINQLLNHNFLITMYIVGLFGATLAFLKEPISTIVTIYIIFNFLIIPLLLYGYNLKKAVYEHAAFLRALNLSVWEDFIFTQQEIYIRLKQSTLWSQHLARSWILGGVILIPLLLITLITMERHPSDTITFVYQKVRSTFGNVFVFILYITSLSTAFVVFITTRISHFNKKIRDKLDGSIESSLMCKAQKLFSVWKCICFNLVCSEDCKLKSIILEGSETNSSLYKDIDSKSTHEPSQLKHL